MEYADFMAGSMSKFSQDRQFKAEIEEVLDWTYPVYTLSTAAVLEAKGVENLEVLDTICIRWMQNR